MTDYSIKCRRELLLIRSELCKSFNRVLLEDYMRVISRLQEVYNHSNSQLILVELSQKETVQVHYVTSQMDMPSESK